MLDTDQKKLPEILTWKAPSHIQPQRSLAWYLGFSLISVGLIVFGVYSHSILTIITFCVIILSVLIFAIQKPKNVTYKATKTGITVDNSVYPYKIIKIFWINYDPPLTKTLNIETSAYLNNRLTLQLADHDPVLLRMFLKQYLPEDMNREESVSEALARRLKI